MSYNVLVDEQLPESFLVLLDDNLDIFQLADLEPKDARYSGMNGFLTYGHMPVTGEIMDRMPNLRVISNFGVGVDHINLDDARKRAIPVGNTPNVLDGAVADMTFALMMAAARNIVIGDRYARSPEFTHYDPSLLHGLEIHDRVIGIVGMGNIGREVAKRARGFDMTILYHNRHRDMDAESKLDVTYATLDDLLASSDFVCLNVPLTEDTRDLIGAAELNRMKSTGILVNMARGAVVDHEALVDALSTNQIAGAALDVTEPEPLPRDHPLLNMHNAIIAPHLGSATVQTRQAMAQLTVDNLMAGLSGQELIRRIA